MIDIIESPLVSPVQKVKLSDACPCSSHVLHAFNAWLLEMFGTQEVCYVIDMQALGLRGSNIFVVNPKHATLLRNFT